MTTTIYYFTGTGNSLYAARKLSEKLGNCPVVSIVKSLASGEPVAGERIVVVFPVYMYRAPRIVCRFLRTIGSASEVIAVATMGGQAGVTFSQVKGFLRLNSLPLRAGYLVAMPDNYIPFGGAEGDEEQRRALESAAKKIDEIAGRIGRADFAIEKDASFIQAHIVPGLFMKLGYMMIPRLSRFFSAEPTCTGCGICEKICPSNTITMKNGRPTWSRSCEQCFACLQWCPVEAIQYGKKSKGRKRYRNPFVKVKDITEQKT
jgi:ferredoxin